MKDQLITVIVPIYNGSKFISQLLDNFSKQQYSNFELLIIDDGSTDDTYSRLLGLKSHYPYSIRVLHQENRGVSAARNLGIDNAKGDYICFCDVDDIYHAYYLQEMYRAIVNNKVSVSVCKLKLQKCDKIIDHCNNIVKDGDVVLFKTIDFLEEFLFLRIIPVHYCLMIEKNLIIKEKIRFAEGYKYGEDYDFSWRTLVKTDNVVFLNKVMYFYILWPGSVMAKFDESRFDTVKVYDNLEIYLREGDFEIAGKFSKYWKARSLWSTVRTAATKMSYRQYLEFIEPYNIRRNMRNLLTYPDFKVAVSSLVFCISPLFFYYLSKIAKVNIR